MNVQPESYPVHFVQRVKEALPGNPALHCALDKGLGDIVERFLSKFARAEVLAEEVLILINSNHTETLLKNCRHLQELQELYREWIGIYRQQRGHPHCR
ncbi:hypothetical protein HYV71_03745 [Candidatus Uhrbacteria bacterium]|nr:hypothetical protein [Candidatus Uhrbacteria bacterium]